MWKWLSSRRATTTTPTEGADPRLSLERESQGLRLELQERDRTLANLRQEFARQQTGERERNVEALRAQLERVLEAAATPVTQLQTQAHRLEAESKPVAAKDVLANARRLVRVLEDEGLTLEGGVDEEVAFDPNRHQPLQGGIAFAPGQPVVIRFAAVSFRGKVLRKAGVVARGE